MGGGGGGGNDPVGKTQMEIDAEERQRAADREAAAQQRAADAQRAADQQAFQRALYDQQQLDLRSAEERERNRELDDQTRAATAAAESRAREDARQAADLADRRQRFTTAIEEGSNRSRMRATEELARYGVAPNAYMDRINNAIVDQRNLVPDLADNAASYFNSDFVADLLDVAQRDRRRQYTNDVNTRWGTGFERGIFGDTADDPFINAVIDDQYNTAATQVERARARGNLGPTGVDGALAELARMRMAGTATAQTLGNTVLENNRGRLRTVADNARTAAGAFNLGDNFDVNAYDREMTDLRGSMTSTLEGDVRNALNGQEFFDIDSILAKGGLSQGGVNPTTEMPVSLIEQMADRERRRQSERGIGGSGTF